MARLHEREATGTSLAAIVFIAAFAAAAAGPHTATCDVLDAVRVGVPAVGGVLIGTWLQQRLAGRSIMLLFAAVLVAARWSCCCE